MSTMAAEQNMLFGLIVLQDGLIAQDQLVIALRAWTRNKARRMADYLNDCGGLGLPQCAAVDLIVTHHF